MRRRFLLCFTFAVAASLSNASVARADGASSVLQPGSNEGTADSFVGNHDWLFSTKPGHFELDISLGRVPTNALPGAPFAVVLHVVPLAGNHVTFAKTPGGYVYKGDMKTSAKCA